MMAGQVLDAGSGAIARVIPDSHARAPHSLVLPRPSSYADLPQHNYEIFLTAATDGVATLWDVRCVSA
jgi:hypothetical protein